MLTLLDVREDKYTFSISLSKYVFFYSRANPTRSTFKSGCEHSLTFTQTLKRTRTTGANIRTMITVNVKHDLEKAIAGLKAFDPNQLRYATARTLTDVAKEVQTEVRAKMPQRFTLRRDWIVKGIRVQYATKQNLSAIVYSKDPFMGLQETGGMKRGKAGGGSFTASSIPGAGPSKGRVAVPLSGVLRTSKQLIRKSDTPQGMGAKAFKIQGKNGVELLARRFSRGKRAGLQVLYALLPQTRLGPRLGLADTARVVIKQRFGALFERNMQQAMKTRR